MPTDPLPPTQRWQLRHEWPFCATNAAIAAATSAGAHGLHGPADACRPPAWSDGLRCPCLLRACHASDGLLTVRAHNASTTHHSFQQCESPPHTPMLCSPSRLPPGAMPMQYSMYPPNMMPPHGAYGAHNPSPPPPHQVHHGTVLAQTIMQPSPPRVGSGHAGSSFV